MRPPVPAPVPARVCACVCGCASRACARLPWAPFDGCCGCCSLACLAAAPRPPAHPSARRRPLQVIDMISGIDDPRRAVDVLVAEANARWMREEQVIDDTTVIVIYLNVT